MISALRQNPAENYSSDAPNAAGPPAPPNALDGSGGRVFVCLAVGIDPFEDFFNRQMVEVFGGFDVDMRAERSPAVGEACGAEEGVGGGADDSGQMRGAGVVA